MLVSNEDLCGDQLCILLTNGTIIRFTQQHNAPAWNVGLIILLVLSSLLMLLILLYLVKYVTKHFKTPFSWPRRVGTLNEARARTVRSISGDISMENGNVIQVRPFTQYPGERQVSYATHYALSGRCTLTESEQLMVGMANEQMDNASDKKKPTKGQQKMSRNKYVVQSSPHVYDEEPQRHCQHLTNID